MKKTAIIVATVAILALAGCNKHKAADAGASDKASASPAAPASSAAASPSAAASSTAASPAAPAPTPAADATTASGKASEAAH